MKPGRRLYGSGARDPPVSRPIARCTRPRYKQGTARPSPSEMDGGGFSSTKTSLEAVTGAAVPGAVAVTLDRARRGEAHTTCDQCTVSDGVEVSISVPGKAFQISSSPGVLPTTGTVHSLHSLGRGRLQTTDDIWPSQRVAPAACVLGSHAKDRDLRAVVQYRRVRDGDLGEIDVTGVAHL